MKLYRRYRRPGRDRWVTNDWGLAHRSLPRKRRRWARWLPLLLVLLALPWLIGCKDCEQLQAALVLARASGNAGAVEAAEKAIAKAGCSVPEKPPADPCEKCPAGTVCRKTAVHGKRSGDVSTWTEGTMVQCVPADTPPVNCLTHPPCEARQHCEQGVGCVPDPLPDPKPPIICEPGDVPRIVDGEVVWCDPAPVPACSIDGEPGPALPDHVAALGDQVNAAMLALRPDCPVGSRCKLQVGRQAWQAEVTAALRLQGLCTGQHNPGTDEIAVATSPTAPREGWHVYAGAEDGPGTVVWSPGASRLAWSAPVTAPDPPPVPDPPATTCPAQPCPDRSKGRWKIKTKPHGPKIVDNTAVTVDQEPYCRAIGMSPMADGTLRAGCPMRPDGHPERSAVEVWVTGGTKLQTCAEAKAADPAMRCTSSGATCELVDGNPFQFYRSGGNCRLCSADALTCGEWM